MKHRWLKFTCERWRAFKVNLGKIFIFNECDETKNPLEKYPYLDQEKWDAFVLSRHDPSFLVNLF